MTHPDADFAAFASSRLDDGYRNWTIAPEQGVVQGPLDLTHFAGEHLRLSLLDDQIALLVRGGVLETVLGAGAHEVPGGGSGRLYFVHLDRDVTWQWQDEAVLWVGPPAARRSVPIIGACAVAVVNAEVFYHTFLSGAWSLEDGHLPGLLDAVVRERLEARLERVTADGTTDPSAIQTLLAQVVPADLTDELADYGLACTRLAVYTRQAPVVETALAGHFPSHRDNNP